jgi:hypothetical protein
MSMVVRTKVFKPNGNLPPVTVLFSFRPFPEPAKVACQKALRVSLNASRANYWDVGDTLRARWLQETLL